MKKDIATSGSKAIAEQRESLASRLAGLGGSSIPTIRVDNRHFIFPDDSTVANEIEVVILDWAVGNFWYGGKPFVRGEASSPECFAIASRTADLVPSRNSPNIQNDGQPCATCWANQFGSHENKKAKACQNRVNLAVMLPEDGPDGEIYRLSVSPTALRNWKDYVSKLNEKRIVPVQVISLVSFDTSVRYDRLLFAAARKHTEKSDINDYAAHIPRAASLLLAEPTFTNNDDE